MLKNNKTFLIYAISLVVAVTAAIVIVGWVFSISILTRFVPNFPAMKFTTAVCFLCSAAISILISKSFKGYYQFAITLLPIPCLIISLFMSLILISVLLGVQTGIENLFVQEDFNALLTVYPGRPSVGAISNFILILSGGLMTMLNPSWIKQFLKVTGFLISLVGGIALVGYLLSQPILFYAVKGVSTAMAINTALLFVLVGTTFILLAKEEE